MKSNLFSSIIVALIAVALLVVPVSAAIDIELSDKQSADISNSCNTIHQNLKNLQRADARARTYFGSIYETISSKYLKPLNLRIVDNDIPNSTLLKLQSEFAEARTKFSDDYIKYSKALEELISIDCQIEPKNFYQKLLDTRSKRTTVAKDIGSISNLLTSIVKNTEKLKETIK
ncbi:hypothetical protein IKG06_02170 [Candidatus Saccharibacteria bacterium]|nr:hypothetical protein [Candidatus Saccharibacteria bacterium]